MVNIVSFFKKNYFIFIEILILFIVSLTPLLWFLPHHMILGLDSGYPINFITHFRERLFAWFEPYTFGTDLTSGLGQIPILGLLALVQFMGFSIYSVQKVTFVFWFFAMAISMYAFVFYLFPKAKYWIIRLVAVFLYIFNFHLLSFWIQGEQTTFSSYVFLPILSLLLLKFFRKEISAFKTAILINTGYLFFNAGGILGIPLLGSSIITGVSICIFYFLILFREERLKIFARVILLGFYSLVLFLLFNAYFLLPFLGSFSHQYASQVGSGNQGIESAIGWNQYISRQDSYINLFRLQGDNSWYNNPHLYSQNYLNNPILIFVSFLFSIFAYVSIFLVRERKEKIVVSLLMLISLVAVIFSAGTHPPFGFIYEFAMRHVPGFAAFRSGYYKFVPALYFSFSVLIGISIFYISEKMKKGYRYIFTFLFLVAILVYHYPFFEHTSLFNYDYPFTTMVNPPNYIFDYMKFEKSLSDDSRVLSLPPYNSNTRTKAYGWGYISASSLFLQVSQKPFVYNDIGLPYPEKNLVDNLYQSIKDSDFNKFIYISNLFNIKYIMVTSDIANNYESATTENPLIYKAIIDKNNNLFTKIWSEGPWALYKININNSTEKLSALNKLNAYNSFAYAKDIVVIDNNQFILEDQFLGSLRKETLNALPISSKLNVYSCKSCLNINKGIFSDVSYRPKIIPGSLFYSLKLFLEKFSIAIEKDLDGKLDSYLGLSMKRVAEIREQVSKGSELNAYDWSNNLDLLLSYWDEINNSINTLQKNNQLDFTLLNKTSQYADLEVEIISNAYDGLFKNNGILRIKLENILWKIKKATPLVNDIFSQYNLNDKFTYDIFSATTGNRAIKLDSLSLLDDVNSNLIFPSSYRVDNEIPNISSKTEQNSLEISNIKNNSKNLTIYFNNIPNLLTDYDDAVLHFPTFARSCILSSIKNYEWNNSYYLQGNIGKTSKEAYLYIERKKDEMVTNNTSRKYSNFFSPDDSFTINNSEDGRFKYELSGSPNDRGILLYFCTGSYENPRDVFSGLNVNQMFQPNVYSIENYEFVKSVMPQVEYKGINPTKYIVTINNATGQYILSFLERFSPLWKAKYLDNGSEIDNHFIINGYANGWLINRKGNYKIEIDFAPQGMLEKGMLISFASIGVLLLLFILNKAIHVYKYYDSKRKTN